MQVFAALCGAKVTNRLSDFLGDIGHPDATNHHRSVSRVQYTLQCRGVYILSSST